MAFIICFQTSGKDTPTRLINRGVLGACPSNRRRYSGKRWDLGVPSSSLWCMTTTGAGKWDEDRIGRIHLLALASFSTLWALQSKLHSPATCDSPRSKNCLKPRACLI